MQWMKVPFGWQIWGWLTLLASLSVHGVLLSLPISLEIEASEPEPEPIAAVPLTKLPVRSLQQPEVENTTAQTESENVAADEETYEPEPEDVAVDEETYDPEPIVRPLATKVSQRRRAQIDRRFEEKPPEMPQAESETSPIPSKKYVINRPSQEDLGDEGQNEKELEEMASQELQIALGEFRGEGNFANVDGASTLALLYGVDDLEILKNSFTIDNGEELKPTIDPAQFRWIDDKTLDQVTDEINASIPKDFFVVKEIPTYLLAGKYQVRIFEVKSQSGGFVRYINLVQLYKDRQPNAGTLFVVWNQPSAPEL